MCTGKALRLIFMGKVLSDNATLAASGIENGAVLHAIASQPPPGAQPVLDSQGRLTRTAGVSTPAAPAATPVLPSAPGVDASQASGNAEQQPLATGGFGRLRALGIDADGIGVLRASYYAGVQEVVASMPRQEGESADAHLARAEEEWMRRQGPFSEFAANLRPLMAAARGNLRANGQSGEGADGDGSGGDDAGHERFLASLPRRQQRQGRGGDDDEETPITEGSWADFMFGFMGGFFLGFIMVLCLFTGRFSRKTRLGILAGACANLAVQLTTEDTRARTSRSSGGGDEGGGDAPTGYPSLRGGGSQLVIH